MVNHSTRPPTFLIVGAGNRGAGFADYIEQHPDQARLVAVAEPRAETRHAIAHRHQLAPNRIFDDWQAAAREDRLADAAIVTTQDAMHAEPAIALMRKGYHVLLEKPMAPTREDCRRIVETVDETGVLFAVAHVMRYTPYSQRLKTLVDAGAIGDIVSVQHVEPVGYWHFAHAYVRGNWRREASSSFMLLAKACHDLDWLRHIVGQPCRAVSSFGELTHFRPQAKPADAGAAIRCLDCDGRSRCPYNAERIYVDRARQGGFGWPNDVLTSEPTVESVIRAVSEGPYGRCVYTGDNDVVDHQVVAMQFENDVTATFTVTGFTRMGWRRTGIFGTRGELYGDGTRITVSDFCTDTQQVYDDFRPAGDIEAAIPGGHGGGDEELMRVFAHAVATGDGQAILSGPAESLETHLMTFASEQARREQRVVRLDERPNPEPLSGASASRANRGDSP